MRFFGILHQKSTFTTLKNNIIVQKFLLYEKVLNNIFDNTPSYKSYRQLKLYNKCVKHEYRTMAYE